MSVESSVSGFETRIENRTVIKMRFVDSTREREENERVCVEEMDEKEGFESGCGGG